MASTGKVEIWINSMGKTFQITHVFGSADAANEHMESHPNSILLAEIDGVCFVAPQYSSTPHLSLQIGISQTAIPERIFLQVEEGEEVWDDIDRTWCAERINVGDIPYIREGKS